MHMLSIALNGYTGPLIRGYWKRYYALYNTILSGARERKTIRVHDIPAFVKHRYSQLPGIKMVIYNAQGEFLLNLRWNYSPYIVYKV